MPENKAQDLRWVTGYIDGKPYEARLHIVDFNDQAPDVPRAALETIPIKKEIKVKTLCGKTMTSVHVPHFNPSGTLPCLECMRRMSEASTEVEYKREVKIGP